MLTIISLDAKECPLLGVKRTCPFALRMSANDPKQTSRATFLQSDGHLGVRFCVLGNADSSNAFSSWIVQKADRLR